MNAPEGTEFCIGCPYVPEGVTAQVENVAFPTMAEYHRYRITHDAPDLVQNFVDSTIKISSTAVESTNPEVEVGDEAVFSIERAGQTEQDVVDAISACPGPRKSRLAKALGQKGTCQAVKAKSYRD